MTKIIHNKSATKVVCKRVNDLIRDKPPSKTASDQKVY